MNYVFFLTGHMTFNIFMIGYAGTLIFIYILIAVFDTLGHNWFLVLLQLAGLIAGEYFFVRACRQIARAKNLMANIRCIFSSNANYGVALVGKEKEIMLPAYVTDDTPNRMRGNNGYLLI